MSGEIVGQAGKLVETDRPPSQAIIDLITAGIRGQAQAGTVRAGAICYDVKLRSPDGATTDAIDVVLEHQSGLAVLVTQPYSKRRLAGFQFSQLSAEAGEVRLFTDAMPQSPGDSELPSTNAVMNMRVRLGATQNLACRPIAQSSQRVRIVLE